MKTCAKCGERLPVEMFGVHRQAKDGLRTWCKPCNNAAARSYAEKNKEKVRARKAERAGQISAYNKEYARRMSEEMRKRRNEAQAAYKKKNAEAVRSWNRARKARKRGAPGRHTAKQIQCLFAMQRGRCAACGRSIAGEYHADHIVALARGGSNDISNIQLLCPPCNLEKHAKDPIEFMQSRGKLL